MKRLYFFKANNNKIPLSNQNPLKTYGPFDSADEAEEWRDNMKAEGLSVGKKYTAGRQHISLYNAINPKEKT